MEYRRTAMALLVAAMATVGQTPALADLKVTSKSTVVHVDEQSPSSMYGFLAAVPASIYQRGGDTVQGLLVSDDAALKPNTYLLADWSAFLQTRTSPSALVLVGAVPSAREQELVAGLSNPSVTRVKGDDPITLADNLARATWKSSDTAVIAPMVATPSDDEAVSLANAAVYASRHNCPLLFVGADSISDESLKTLKDLGVSKVVVYDLTKKLADTTLAPLAGQGITVSQSIREIKDSVAAALAGADSSTICIMQSGFQGLSAAIAAARYQGVVQKLPASIQKVSVRAMASIPRMMRMLTRKLPTAVKDDSGPASPEADLAAKFYDWLASIGADNPNKLETVITFGQGTESSGIPLTLERSLSGDPTKPTQKGALTSRMPGSSTENIAYINRTTLYPALIFANPHPSKSTMSMVAYEVQNNGGTSTGPFGDTDGKQHRVNEFFGCKDGGYSDPGVYQTLKDRGYQISFHDGRAEGQAEDPVNHEHAWGFWKDLKDGTSYYYDSSHGGPDAWYPMATDTGIVSEMEFGQQYWPSVEGRVNQMGDGYSNTNVDQDYENLHSPVLIFNACLIGGGPVMNVLMEHGAAGAIGSYTSVSFDGGGYYCCLFTDRMTTAGATLGEATANAMARCSQVFPIAQTNGDSSLRFVLFGDAKMEYMKPGWTKPTPVAPEALRTGGVAAVNPAPPAPPANPPAGPAPVPVR